MHRVEGTDLYLRSDELSEKAVFSSRRCAESSRSAGGSLLGSGADGLPASGACFRETAPDAECPTA